WKSDDLGPYERVVVARFLARGERVAAETEHACADDAALAHDSQRGHVRADPNDARVGDARRGNEASERVDPRHRRGPAADRYRREGGSRQNERGDRDVGVHLERTAVVPLDG